MRFLSVIQSLSGKSFALKKFQLQVQSLRASGLEERLGPKVMSGSKKEVTESNVDDEWRELELEEHRLALSKDVFVMAALLLGSIRASRLLI